MSKVDKQLQVLETINSILCKHTIPFWLFGGWGIDGLLNRITREHDDIDILISYADKKKLTSALKGIISKIKYWNEKSITMELDGVKIDFRFFVMLSNGDIALDLDESDLYIYPFPNNSVDKNNIGIINNKEYKVVNWEFHYIATVSANI